MTTADQIQTRKRAVAINCLLNSLVVELCRDLAVACEVMATTDLAVFLLEQQLVDEAATTAAQAHLTLTSQLCAEGTTEEVLRAFLERQDVRHDLLMALSIVGIEVPHSDWELVHHIVNFYAPDMVPLTVAKVGQA